VAQLQAMEVRGDEMQRALLERLRTPIEIDDDVRGTIALDITDGEAWSLEVHGSKLKLALGSAPEADTTITTDTETMVAVLRGDVSGIEAFVQGKLNVRGNLALSMRLSGSFDPATRPANFARARTVEAAGIKTFLLEAGEGPPVVLLHGLGATNASMLTTLSELGKDHHVFAPDLPGFGESEKPIRSYDAAFFGRWLVALLDALGIEKAHLVGNSLGGRIAIEGALLAPDRIDRLVLLAPSPAFIKRREFVRLVKVLRPEMALLPVSLIPKSRVAPAIKAMFSRPSRLPNTWYDSAADEFLRVFKTPRGRVAFFSAARHIYLEEPFGESGFWERLQTLSRPALFIWGARDRLVPAGFARHVERALPQAESVVLQDCGHVPQYEHPEKTHRLIREFFGS
jgi:pimeloyl-ACP methyl ester carboxylesterase/putative sterol carrier protein